MKLRGHFAVFDEWTRIDSREGLFLERIAAGAFRKTIIENGDRVRVLLNHGNDPELGDKPLGPIETLREDSRGVFYEVPLLDGVPELVKSGLGAGLYGASFRFSSLREEFVQRPERAEHNPEGIPERTLREVRLHEFGPVTFAQYAGATASARSSDGVVELRAAAGRHEVIPKAIGQGDAPVTIRRLRADGSRRARELMRELEQGARVEIVWGASGTHLGRIIERGSTETARNGKPWRLPPYNGEPGTWRL